MVILRVAKKKVPPLFWSCGKRGSAVEGFVVKTLRFVVAVAIPYE